MRKMVKKGREEELFESGWGLKANSVETKREKISTFGK